MFIKVYKLLKDDDVTYYLGKLLEKICSTKRVAVLCNQDNIVEIDKRLWTFSKGSFLPHGIEGQCENEVQPVLLYSSLKEDIALMDMICVISDNLPEVVKFVVANNHQLCAKKGTDARTNDIQGKTIICFLNENDTQNNFNELVSELKDDFKANLEVFIRTKQGWDKQEIERNN